MKTAIAIVFGALLLVGASRTAHADGSGYVCDIVDLEQATSVAQGLGNFGAIWFDIYSGKSCSGNYVFGGYTCTTGSTSTVCGPMLLSQPELMNMSAKLQRAQLANQNLYVWTSSRGMYQLLYNPAGY
jgi:hypothetical protein